jgi:exodeoxyribonuclease-3
MSTPKLKRVAVAAPQSAKPSKRARPNNGLIRLLSWNIDSPNWFLPAKDVGTTSGPIDRFFSIKPSPPSSSSFQKGKARAKDLSDANAPNSPPSLRDILKSHGWPDIVFLQEVRSLHKDKETIRKLREAPNHGAERATTRNHSPSTSSDSEEDTLPTSADGPTYTAFFSLNRSKVGSGRFGVATYISSSFTEEYTVREVDWDHEGRLLLLNIQSLELVIVNVYALNSSEYAWKDPLTNQERGTRSQRKREFNRLLMLECQEIQKQGYRLVMVGDWNISLEARDCFPRLRTEEPHAQARKEFNEVFMPTLDVVDIFRAKHGDKRSYSVSRANFYRIY